MKLQIGERVAEVEIGADSVRLDGVEHPVEWRAGRLRIGHRFYAVRGSRRELWIDGRRYLSRELAAGGKPVSPTTFDGSIRASMPGTVLALKIEVGDPVEAGQPVLLMESMKMELTVESPGAGRVREIRCSPGTLVGVGEELVRLEVDPSPEEPPR